VTERTFLYFAASELDGHRQTYSAVQADQRTGTFEYFGRRRFKRDDGPESSTSLEEAREILETGMRNQCCGTTERIRLGRDEAFVS